jgi:hypothetical protein
MEVTVFAFENPKSKIQNPKSTYPMPHMPRSAAPQEPQGPDSTEAAECDDPPTANTDKSFSTLGLEHFLQATFVVDEGTIFSNIVPHSRHLNSKSGIRSS